MIDAMTLAEAGVVFSYWQDHPPVHLLVAAFMGVKPRRAPGMARPTAREDARAVAALPGMGQGTAADMHRGLGAPVLDFAALKRQAGR